MRAIIFSFLLICLGPVSLKAQVLEVPTLKSKGLNGSVKTIEWHAYQAVAEKGLTYFKTDKETYDDKGRLMSVLTENHQNNQSYQTLYTLDKKGVLTEVKIVNPSNNLSLRITSYEYKKGLLVKTTQTQGTNTVVKNYSYNKQKQLVEVEVIQNGTLSLNEYYELDGEDRRTKVSRKLPGETEAKVTSTFTYQLAEGVLTIIENRFTVRGEFLVTKTRDVASKRDLTETTKRLSDGQEANNGQFFEDDEQGNWIKGEVLGDQHSRVRMVLRKITYADGTVSGRDKMAFPEDYHAQYIRQYSQKQVAVNGKVYNSGIAYTLDYTEDRLVYVPDLNAWVLLKKYDKNMNMKTWDKAQVLGGGKDAVFWAASSTGISVFNAGKKIVKGTARTNYSAYPIGNSYAAYIRGDVNQSFLVENPAARAGQVIQAELTTDHFHWGKVSDSTYVLTNRGSSVGLQKQIEDKQGNKLAMYRQGSLYYWYFLPGFRDRYDNSQVGDLHPAEQVYDTEKLLSEEKYKADFSKFGYTKLANTRYRLLTADGQSVTNIASKTIKAPDDQLFAYFPLTKQYLLMEKFYELEKGKEWPNQQVRVVSDSTAYVYYMYNDNKSINFYTPDGRIEKRAFANHKLDPNKRAYGAVVYDSTNNVSYGMNYDLDAQGGFGPMRKLPANGRGAYIIKLEGGRWVIVEKGIKVKDYTFSKISKNGTVVHFFKDQKGKTKALEFRDFESAQVGAILYGTVSIKSEFDRYLKEFGIDPALKKAEVEDVLKGKPMTFDREGTMLYARDDSGKDIGHQFSWFVSSGTGDDLIAYDSVGKATYRIHGFYASDNVTEGKVERIVGTDDLKALKWRKSNVYLSIKGELQKDVARSFITQNAEDSTWREVFYDQSEEQSYEISYPSDSNFYVVDLKPIAASHNQAYLFRINEKKFVMIERGKLVRNKEIRSRELENDLIRMIPESDGVKGYLFRGYKSAGMLELIPAEAMTDAELKSAWAESGEALKEKGAETANVSPPVPNDQWMTAINGCGDNASCINKLIDQMGTAIKKNGYGDNEMLVALVPYLVGIANTSKERLFKVVMEMDSKYLGTISHPDFPEELKQYIRGKSMATVKDYEKKYGSPKIKTVPYKKKGNGNS